MVKGHVLNNTGKAKHIFKKTVYSGGRITLDDAYAAVASRVPEGQPFLEWLHTYLPPGWELQITEDYEEPFEPSKVKPEDVKAVTVTTHDAPEKHLLSGEDDDDSPSLEYAPAKTLDKLTARDIFNLRMKDNPKRVIKQIASVHKLRRALTLCKNDARKSMLAAIIRHRIKELNG